MLTLASHNLVNSSQKNPQTYSTNFTKICLKITYSVNKQKDNWQSKNITPTKLWQKQKEQNNERILIITTLSNCVLNWQNLTTTEQVWIQVVYDMLCSSGFYTSLQSAAHIVTTLHVSKHLKHFRHTRCITGKFSDLQQQPTIILCYTIVEWHWNSTLEIANSQPLHSHAATPGKLSKHIYLRSQGKESRVIKLLSIHGRK